MKKCSKNESQIDRCKNAAKMRQKCIAFKTAIKTVIETVIKTMIKTVIKTVVKADIAYGIKHIWVVGYGMRNNMTNQLRQDKL